MAVVKFSRKEFEKYVKLNEKIKERISMFGTPLEYVDKKEVAIEIFPNRPDLLSLQGYMRSFIPFLGKRIFRKKVGLKQYSIKNPEKNYEVKIDKSVREVRPYTACAIVKKLKFNDEKIKEIIDIQEKIHATLGRNRKKIAIGIYPLEKILLPIKYEARKPDEIRFIPLEEKKEMTAMQILHKHPTGKEYAHLLESKKKFPVFLDVADNILSMPPIINSEKTGKITKDTKEVFIECSGFDFDVLKKALNIIVTMLADMGGKIYQMRLDYGSKKRELTPDLQPEKMKINLNKINKLLGLELREKEIKNLLERMGYEYKNKEVLIPAWRTDILHEVDIAEDIAIAYGYNNLKPKLPEISTLGEEAKEENIKRKIAEILAGLGFLEISSYHLLTRQDIKKVNKKIDIEIEKSKTDYQFLRSDLLCSMLKVLSENTDAEYSQKVFEMGKVFEKDNKAETGIKEKDKLIIAITPGNFTEIKQVLDYLASMLNMKFEVSEISTQNFIDGRTGNIAIGGKQIGIIGEIHPSTLRAWHLKMPLVCLEIDLEKILHPK